MTGTDAFMWAIFAALGMGGIVLLSSAVTQGGLRGGQAGTLRITRRRTQDRINTVTLVAMAAWIAASGILLFRVNSLTTTAEQALAEAALLRLEVAELQGLTLSRATPVQWLAYAGAGETATGWVDTGTTGMPLLLRESPGGAVITQVEGGAEVKLLAVPVERVNGREWISVESVDGRTGWVAAENIRVANLGPDETPPGAQN